MQYVLNIVLLEVFVIVSSFVPQYSGMFFIVYFIAIMVVVVFFTGKSARKILRELEELMDAEVLFRARKETIAKLRARDRGYEKEMGGQAKYQIGYLLLLSFFIFLFSNQSLRSYIAYIAEGIVGKEDVIMLNFIQYQLLYTLFFLLSFVGFRFLGKYSKGGPTPSLMVPSSYIITSRGIILEDRLPLSFPLKVKNCKINSSRRFLELEFERHPLQSGMTMMASTGSFKVRLYAPNPKEVWNIIRNNVTVEEAGRKEVK